MKIFENLFWYPYKIHGFTSNITAIQQGNETWLIDLGSSQFFFFKSFIARLRTDGLNPRNISRVYLTHLHPDHISAYRKLKKYSNFTLYLHSIASNMITEENDRFWKFQMEKASNFRSEFFKIPLWLLKSFTNLQMGTIPLVNIDKQVIFSDENVFGTEGVSPYTFEIIHTPGHSPDHCSFYNKKLKLLIAGDIIGRKYAKPVLNLPLADFSEYKKSLKLLQSLNVEKWITGHGEQIFTNSVKYEKLIQDTLNNLEVIRERTLKYLENNSSIKKFFTLSDFVGLYPEELFNKIEQKTVAFSILNSLKNENIVEFDKEHVIYQN